MGYVDKPAHRREGRDRGGEREQVHAAVQHLQEGDQGAQETNRPIRDEFHVAGEHHEERARDLLGSRGPGGGLPGQHDAVGAVGETEREGAESDKLLHPQVYGDEGAGGVKGRGVKGGGVKGRRSEGLE